jgi:cation transport ATPase
MRLIRTNFNLAVGINTAILGAAAIGRLSPVASALLHNGSTLGILGNALTGGRLSGGFAKKKADPEKNGSASGE